MHLTTHAPASISFEIGSIVYGILFAPLAGYVASFIGGRPNSVAAWTVGALIALGSVVSMMLSGFSWSPIVAPLFMAPAAVIGGRSYVVRSRRARIDDNTK